MSASDGDEPTSLPSWFPDLDGDSALRLGTYRRKQVSNVDSHDEANRGRGYFDLGLRSMLSYQHELASRCFLACLYYSPDCALAHSLVSLCHCQDYNFKGVAYYESTNHPEESHMEDEVCVFPSQQLAARHSLQAVEKVEQLRKLHRKQKGSSVGGKKKKGGKGKKKKQTAKPEASKEGEDESPSNGSSTLISDVESQLVAAIRLLTCNPGVNADLADELAGRPYAVAMRGIYRKYPEDAEVAYFFAEALMVLNAWKLYEYPTGRPLSEDVAETREVLETTLKIHSDHAGLCHMYVHLSEMSPDPGKALEYCPTLRRE